jgi:uncharacterized protein (TIGR04255 family)
VASDNEFFEDSPRVIYDKSPLQGVICQVRFPTILRIESQPPAEFQEAIRHVFPIFSRTRQIGLQNLPPEIANMVGEAAQQPIQYQFRTEDNSSTIGLQPGSLSLTCRDYNRWENFSTLLEPALEALIRSYNPSFFSRIGLRYQNAIVPTQLGLDNEPWSEIISSNVLGWRTCP